MTANKSVFTLLVLSVLALLSVLGQIIFSLQNFLFASILFLILAIILSAFLLFLKSKNKNDLELLKKEVESKDNEIQKLTSQIKIQDEEILHQIEFLREQTKIIELQKNELEDSNKCAFKIQQAILPDLDYTKSFLNELFVLYLPKTTASGDFYYIRQINDYIIIAAVDCVGHGIYGAIMTFMAYEKLNQAIITNRLTKPSDILSFINESLSNFLSKFYDKNEASEVVKISVITIHQFHKLVEFAAAKQSLFYTHKGKIFEVKGNRLSIGVNNNSGITLFDNHALQVSKGDMIYLFSDGYINQLGGPNNKKFKHQQFKNLLLEISKLSMNEQKEIINNTFIKWKANNVQVDDILVLGIRI